MFHRSGAIFVKRGAILACLVASMSCASSVHRRSLIPVKSESEHSLPGYIKGSADSKADQVIVFVHGVLGDGSATWTNDTTHAYFPQLVANDPTFRAANVYVHDYPTPRFTRSYSIDELADHLRRHLRNDNVLINHRQVIFVAHSMGGLAVRAYLLKYREDLPPERVPLLYFLSTPTTGADIASFARLVSNNPQLADMRKMKTGKSGVLATWDSQWNSSPYPRKVKSYCAYELLPTFGIQVVQRESAEHLCNTRPDPIHADHIGIAKPTGPKGESFIAFRTAYREVFGTRSSFSRPPVWNLREQPRGFVQASTTSADPACDNCWSPELAVEPGQRFYLRIHYENDGELAARNTQLNVSVPTDLLSDPMISVRLSADDTDPLHGAACVGSPTVPLMFIPEKAYWYPNNATAPLPLPYTQSAAEITSTSGLALGDVSGGLAFASEIVVAFRALPITVAVLRNVQELASKLEPSIRARGGNIDVDDLSRLMSPVDLNFTTTEIDFDDAMEPRGSASLGSLFPGEVVMMFVFVHNEHTVPLHDAVMAVSTRDTGRHGLRLTVLSRETTFHAADVFTHDEGDADSLSFLAAFRIPPGFCESLTTVADVWSLPRDEDASDGISIGDLAPEETTQLLCLFKVE